MSRDLSHGRNPVPGDGDADAPSPERDDLPERASVIRAAADARAHRRAELTGRPSIAVLSFAGAGGEEAHDELGSGLVRL